MGIKEMGLLLIMFFCHLCLPAAPSPLHKTLPSVLLQENNFKDKEMDKNSNNGGSGSGIVNHYSVSHRGGAAAMSGGRASGHGQNGNNGESTTTPAGGTSVIPIYAAGAANGHHPNNNHHSGSSRCNWSCLGISTLGAAILATLALHINVAFGFEN